MDDYTILVNSLFSIAKDCRNAKRRLKHIEQIAEKAGNSAALNVAIIKQAQLNNITEWTETSIERLVPQNFLSQILSPTK